MTLLLLVVVVVVVVLMLAFWPWFLPAEIDNSLNIQGSWNIGGWKHGNITCEFFKPTHFTLREKTPHSTELTTPQKRGQEIRLLTSVINCKHIFFL